MRADRWRSNTQPFHDCTRRKQRPSNLTDRASQRNARTPHPQTKRRRRTQAGERFFKLSHDPAFVQTRPFPSSNARWHSFLSCFRLHLLYTPSVAPYPRTVLRRVSVAGRHRSSCRKFGYVEFRFLFCACPAVDATGRQGGDWLTHNLTSPLRGVCYLSLVWMVRVSLHLARNSTAAGRRGYQTR